MKADCWSTFLAHCISRAVPFGGLKRVLQRVRKQNTKNEFVTIGFISIRSIINPTYPYSESIYKISLLVIFRLISYITYYPLEKDSSLNFRLYYYLDFSYFDVFSL